MFARTIAYLTLLMCVSACMSEDSVGGPSTEPTRTFSGIWLYQFEGSTFVEGANAIPKYAVRTEDVAWLDFHPEEVEPAYLHLGIENASHDYDRYDVERECYPRFAFAISFEGARTTYPKLTSSLPGGGHMGLWGSDISVESVSSITPLAGDFC